MDAHTLKLLEFDKVRELVAQYAPGPLGRDRVRALAPATDLGVIRTQQSLVAEMVRALRSHRAAPLGGLGDIRSLVRQARVEAVLSAEMLRDVAGTLAGLKRLRDYLIQIAAECPLLGNYSLQVHDMSRVSFSIEACIDQRAHVLDSASRELARLRHEIEKLDQRIRALMQRLLRSEAVRRALRYPNFTVTGSHYVLPVVRDHRHDVAGVVHRASTSGDTLFIEPAEVAEMSVELAALRAHEAKEVNRILRQLSAEVGKQAHSILESLEAGAELSSIYARARYACDFGLVEPAVEEGSALHLVEARHPLLEHLFRAAPHDSPSCRTDAARGDLELHRDAPEPLQAGEPGQRSVVPMSVHLGDRFDVLIVTGPNTGGKTVALKTVGLLAVMAQSGLHIPAAPGTVVPVFDQVLADIGDEQSLEQSLSTFSSHVSRIEYILRSATRRSLVLLDELGSGTEPAEGAALGRAILDHLLELGARAVVTTHLGDLKLYALTHPRAENAAAEFDPVTLLPTYQLRTGNTGQSCALVVAARLGLPDRLLARAETYLATSRAGRPQEIEVLERRRAEAESARQLAWEAEQEARRAKEAYELRLRELDQQSLQALELDRFRSGLQPGDTVLVRKFRRSGIVQRIDRKRRTATVSHGSMHWQLNLDELLPPTE